MLFDWFTAVAQIVNFLILVVLLKRFLYRPIIRVMNEREQKIASQLEHAKQKEQEAEQEAETYRQKVYELDDSRRQMFEKVQMEVDAWRQEKLNEARVEVEAVQQRRQQSIQQEYEALLSHMRHRTTEQVIAIARRALVDLANADLEEQISAIFIERLKDLDGDELVALKESVQNSEPGIIITSAFDLPADVLQDIQFAIDQQAGPASELVFEKSPDVICGIELRSSGHKVAWSFESYLETLDESMSELFQEHVRGVE